MRLILALLPLAGLLLVFAVTNRRDPDKTLLSSHGGRIVRTTGLLMLSGGITIRFLADAEPALRHASLEVELVGLALAVYGNIGPRYRLVPAGPERAAEPALRDDPRRAPTSAQGRGDGDLCYELKGQGKARTSALVLSSAIALLALPVSFLLLAGKGNVYNILQVASLLACAGWIYWSADREQTVRIVLGPRTLAIYTRRGTPVVANLGHITRLWGPWGDTWTLVTLTPDRPWWAFRLDMFSDEPVPENEKPAFRKALRERHARART